MGRELWSDDERDYGLTLNWYCNDREINGENNRDLVVKLRYFTDEINCEPNDKINCELVDAMNSELVDETKCELDCQEDYKRICELIPNKTTHLLVLRVWDRQIFGVTVYIGIY